MSESPEAAKRDEPAAESGPGTEAPALAPQPVGWRRYVSTALAMALAALAVSAWQWHDNRGQLRAIKQELGKRLAETDTQSKESRIVTEQVREAVADAQVKLGVLEARIAESQNQQIALEALYQELSRNRDEWAYAEIEQAINIAAQQLQLAGNVKAALIALQTADARLQRMDRPQLLALRRAINRDSDRLKALPFVDTLAISTRLDNMIAGVDRFPLAMEMRPQPDAEAPVVARRQRVDALLARGVVRSEAAGAGAADGQARDAVTHAVAGVLSAREPEAAADRCAAVAPCPGRSQLQGGPEGRAATG
jgi:uroporphyrin-3 C-methyltransferase